MAFIKKEYTDGFFNVGKENGFLPKSTPLESLPKTYFFLQELLDKMPVKINNESGYLDQPGAIHNAVKSLPNYFDQVSTETDIMLIQALYRGYCFFSISIYLRTFISTL
jgi:indoleamine 2,3-dioxygenase